MSILGSDYALTFAAILAPALAFTLSKLFRSRRAKNPPAWIQEHADLGVQRQDTDKIPGTAVVCGGSIAGIITARICADHFEKVIIVDPEFNQTLAGGRKTRVMQYNAFHAYLAILMDGLRRLWPDFDAEVTAAGGIFGDTYLPLYISGIPVLPSDIHRFLGPLPAILHMRRPNFERSLQKLLVAHPTFASTRVIDGTVRRIERSKDGRSITSVMVRDLEGHSVTLSDVTLLADCTGRSQAGIKWLTSSGYNLPSDIRLSYNAKLSYMTITFTVSDNLARMLASAPGPGDVGSKPHVPYVYSPHPSRGNAVYSIAHTDNDKVQLVFAGYDEPNLPNSLDAVVPFLRNFKGHEPIPSWVFTMTEIIIEYGVEPSFEPVKTSPFTRVRYDEAKDLPTNFVAVGDSAMSLNPAYGQGCTKAMLGALALNAILASHDHKLPIPPDLGKRYFQRLASRTQGLWDSSRFTDYGFATTEPIQGETLATGRLARWVSDKLMSASSKDGEVASTLWRVVSLTAQDSELYSPRILWKILWTSSRFGSQRK